MSPYLIVCLSKTLKHVTYLKITLGILTFPLHGCLTTLYIHTITFEHLFLIQNMYVHFLHVNSW